jgi:hypothetical protein
VNLTNPADRIRRRPFTLNFSIYTAFAGSILTPALETVRRWHQLSDPQYFINWFDDYLIGGFLFFAAWKAFRSATGSGSLIAAWGVASGMAFSSFVSQMQSLHQPDPAPVSSGMVAIVKGSMLIICLVCLMFSIGYWRRQGQS